MFIQLALVLAGLLFTVWSISVLAVLLTPLPVDPWRKQPAPGNGEYFRMSDGAELFMRHWLPVGKAGQVILALHGLGQHSGYHRRFGSSIAESGVAYYAFDLRGNGMTRTAHGDIPSVERSYDDVNELVAILRQRHPRASIFVLGHSIGGAMAASWAAERNPNIAGLMVVSPAMTANAASIPLLNYLKGPAAWMFFPHRPILRPGHTAYARERLTSIINIPEEVEFVLQDPLRLQAMSMQFALAANRFRKETISLASQIRVPTLTLVGKADPAYIGAKQLYDALTVEDKSFIAIPDVGHMVLQIQEMPLVLEQATSWLDSHVLSKSNSAIVSADYEEEDG